MPKSLDLTGQRFGRLLVAERVGSVSGMAKGAVWFCRCDCGGTAVVYASSLISGDRRSCGCAARGRRAHEHHGYAARSNRRLYNVWNAMRQRCSNPNQPHYERYGGRGIKVCRRWNNSFAAFLADMDEPPTAGHALERIDNDGNYEPTNCRWATHAEQNANQRPRRTSVTAKTTSWKGEKHHNAKLNDDAVRLIRASDEKLRILAERYGVSLNQIKLIRRRLAWAHVT